MRKSDAAINQDGVQHLFESMTSEIAAPDIMIYTDGSVSSNPVVTSCAFYIPTLDSSGSWRLTPGSSIFSAELHGIKQALSAIYNYDTTHPGIHIFSDSSAAIKAVTSSQTPKNRCIGEIRNLSETSNVTHWIPSDTGIAGNEKAERLAADEAHSPSGNYISNELSPGEKCLS